ncbi:hypothetical protein KML001_50740 [Klebsiella quasipneumoniae subsp. similipneumoniae]|nr:hypothetical protein KML001_50740 [Klebsiella quasipneumoniae subsp. similipneumoniae]
MHKGINATPIIFILLKVGVLQIIRPKTPYTIESILNNEIVLISLNVRLELKAALILSASGKVIRTAIAKLMDVFLLFVRAKNTQNNNGVIR